MYRQLCHQGNRKVNHGTPGVSSDPKGLLKATLADPQWFPEISRYLVYDILITY